MSEQTPFDPKTVQRMVFAGGILAVVAILLFVLLWVILGSAGVQQFQRLILSLCVPPAVIALLLGGYFLFSRRT